MAGRLQNKRVLITGGSSGIGLLAARRFAAEGARLALLARGEEALGEAIRRERHDALPLAADVTDREAVDRAVAAAVAHLGGLDLVVLNAAAASFGHFLEVGADDFDRAVDVTFRGSVNVVRAALPHLRESRGTIVATGSLVTRVPAPAWSGYTAAKHALRGFLGAVRIEEREQRSGVRVAMVHPGIVDTPFWPTATSATGAQPRVPPAGYEPDVAATALVEAAVNPRREAMVGVRTLLYDRAFLVARPIADRVLVVADRWLRSGDEPAPRPGSLWSATESPRASGGVRVRGELIAQAFRLRRRLSAPVPERPARRR